MNPWNSQQQLHVLDLSRRLLQLEHPGRWLDPQEWEDYVHLSKIKLARQLIALYGVYTSIRMFHEQLMNAADRMYQGHRITLDEFNHFWTNASISGFYRSRFLEARTYRAVQILLRRLALHLELKTRDDLRGYNIVCLQQWVVDRKIEVTDEEELIDYERRHKIGPDVYGPRHFLPHNPYLGDNHDNDLYESGDAEYVSAIERNTSSDEYLVESCSSTIIYSDLGGEYPASDSSNRQNVAHRREVRYNARSRGDLRRLSTYWASRIQRIEDSDSDTARRLSPIFRVHHPLSPNIQSSDADGETDSEDNRVMRRRVMTRQQRNRRRGVPF